MIKAKFRTSKNIFFSNFLLCISFFTLNFFLYSFTASGSATRARTIGNIETWINYITSSGTSTIHVITLSSNWFILGTQRAYQNVAIQLTSLWVCILRNCVYHRQQIAFSRNNDTKLTAETKMNFDICSKTAWYILICCDVSQEKSHWRGIIENSFYCTKYIYSQSAVLLFFSSFTLKW